MAGYATSIHGKKSRWFHNDEIVPSPAKELWWHEQIDLKYILIEGPNKSN